jgi:DnaJ-class molecular chaperone
MQEMSDQPRYVIMCDACDGLGHDDDWAWPRTCSACRGTGCVEDDDDYGDDDWLDDNVAMNEDPGM